MSEMKVNNFPTIADLDEWDRRMPLQGTREHASGAVEQPSPLQGQDGPRSRFSVSTVDSQEVGSDSSYSAVSDSSSSGGHPLIDLIDLYASGTDHQNAHSGPEANSSVVEGSLGTPSIASTAGIPLPPGADKIRLDYYKSGLSDRSSGIPVPRQSDMSLGQNPNSGLSRPATSVAASAISSGRSSKGHTALSTSPADGPLLLDPIGGASQTPGEGSPLPSSDLRASPVPRGQDDQTDTLGNRPPVSAGGGVSASAFNRLRTALKRPGRSKQRQFPPIGPPQLIQSSLGDPIKPDAVASRPDQNAGASSLASGSNANRSRLMSALRRPFQPSPYRVPRDKSGNPQISEPLKYMYPTNVSPNLPDLPELEGASRPPQPSAFRMGSPAGGTPGGESDPSAVLEPPAREAQANVEFFSPDSVGEELVQRDKPAGVVGLPRNPRGNIDQAFHPRAPRRNIPVAASGRPTEALLPPGLKRWVDSEGNRITLPSEPLSGREGQQSANNIVLAESHGGDRDHLVGLTTSYAEAHQAGQINDETATLLSNATGLVLGISNRGDTARVSAGNIRTTRDS